MHNRGQGEGEMQTTLPQSCLDASLPDIAYDTPRPVSAFARASYAGDVNSFMFCQAIQRRLCRENAAGTSTT